MNCPIVTEIEADWLCIDIETTAGRPESAEEWMRKQWSPDSRWTPDTIGKRYVEALAKKREKLALLDAAPICVVAVAVANGRMILHSLKTQREQTDFGYVVGAASEKEMLIELRELLSRHVGPETLIVGHNVRQFDLPRLRLAFLRAGLQLPLALGSGQPCFDSMREWCRSVSVERSEMVALSEVLEKLGMVNHKVLVDGSQMDQLIVKGEIETILRYAALDVTAESEVFLRLTGRSAQLT